MLSLAVQNKEILFSEITSKLELNEDDIEEFVIDCKSTSFCFCFNYYMNFCMSGDCHHKKTVIYNLLFLYKWDYFLFNKPTGGKISFVH